MEYYEEYPIRCKTCNGQIACYSYEYREYLNSGSTIQQALDSLGLTNYCCRIAMKDPVVVTFDMENRKVIEGSKKIDAADDFGVSSVETPNTAFEACLSTDAVKEQPKPRRPVVKGIQPLAALDLSNATAVGDGIEIDPALFSAEFTVPTAVGISTINRTGLGKPEVRQVGSGKEIKVLSGRTYLAR